MTAAQLEAWMIERVSRRLKIPAHDVDPVRRLQEYGLDSLEALSLTGEIEALLGRPVEPTILWDHPTIRAVASSLAPPEREMPPEASSGGARVPV
jgi:acyl carrier protein